MRSISKLGNLSNKKFKFQPKTSKESFDDNQNKKLRQAQFELKKLKEEIAKKNVEVLALTKDLEKYDAKQSGLSSVPAINNMKRKTTFSAQNSEKIDAQPKRTLTQISKSKVSSQADVKVKHRIRTESSERRRKLNLQKAPSLSILNEESERNTPEDRNR